MPDFRNYYGQMTVQQLLDERENLTWDLLADREQIISDNSESRRVQLQMDLERYGIVKELIREKYNSTPIEAVPQNIVGRQMEINRIANRRFIEKRNDLLGMIDGEFNLNCGSGTLKNLVDKYGSIGRLSWGNLSLTEVEESYGTSYKPEDGVLFVVCPIRFNGKEVARQVFISKKMTKNFDMSKVQDKTLPFIYSQEDLANNRYC